MYNQGAGPPRGHMPMGGQRGGQMMGGDQWGQQPWGQQQWGQQWGGPPMHPGMYGGMGMQMHPGMYGGMGDFGQMQQMGPPQQFRGGGRGNSSLMPGDWLCPVCVRTCAPPRGPRA